MMSRVVLTLSAILFALPSMAEAGLFNRGCGYCSTGCDAGCGYDSCDTGCGYGSGCASTSCAPEPTYVDKVIMVPTYVWEDRVVNKTICEPETREKVYKVCKRIPETNYVTKHYTVNVPEWKTKLVDYYTTKPVWTTKPVTKTVMVPHYEPREGSRRVCKMVPHTIVKTRCVNRGYWEEVPVTTCGTGYASSCGSCAGYTGCGSVCGGCDTGCGSSCGSSCGTSCGSSCAPATAKRWVNNYVTEEYECQVMKPVYEDVPYTYNVCVMKPEPRTYDVKVCEMVKEHHQKEVRYMVCKQEVRSKDVPVTTYRTVYEDKVSHYTVMVPRQVQETVKVKVCKMVPKTIQVPVYPTCNTCDSCDTSSAPVCTSCGY